MNPVYTQVLTSILFRLLTVAGGWFIAQGWLTTEEVDQMMSPTVELAVGLVLSAIGAGYGILRTFWDREKITTALATQPMTEKALEQKIADGTSAPPSTPKNVMPTVTVKK